MVKDIISLVRPQQWSKNVFIFLPIFFSRKLGDGACLSSALIAFVIYCLVAGSIYCLNDICDRESDRLHPTKCRRPIASGAVSMGAGYGIMALLLVLAIALTFGFNRTARVADKCRYLFYFEYSLLFLVETYCVGRCFCDIDRLCVKGSCGWSRYGDMDFAVDYLDDVSVGSVFVVCQKAGRRTHL